MWPRWKCAPFPLTPALSLGERGKRSLSLGETTRSFCSTTIRISESGQRPFLLPEGEGQDEGGTRFPNTGHSRLNAGNIHLADTVFLKRSKQKRPAEGGLDTR